MRRDTQEHELYDRWWKNAIIYCLDVETYLDSDGDGVGDFAGLLERVDYLADLGVTCLWLMPFYPTPNRDDGYDVTDHYGLDERLGDFGDFTDFVRAANSRGMRVIADLVINHTSIEHPWFQAARQDRESRYHDYYVWQDERPADWETGLVFPGEQTENWTYDRTARRYYLHNFYRHQADLNPNNPAVRREMKQIISFWLQQDLAGFRVDAVPFLIEPDGIQGQLELTPHGFLRELSAHLRLRRGDAILLGEVNLRPEEQREFFGNGDELHMIFNFFTNQHIYLALAREDAEPLRTALAALPPIPEGAQWANFLTNHDELTLDKLTDAQRQEVFEAFGPDPDMQLYGRGIRRRLPTMLNGDRRRIELAYSLLFSLPGTPTLFYGEEIGMGENLDVEGRRSVRTPMQWTSGENGGFSQADAESIRRPFPDGPYGPAEVNVAEQHGRPDSLLSWMQRLIARRRATPEFGLGEWTLLDVGSSNVLMIRYDWGERAVVAVNNLATDEVEVDIAAHIGDAELVDIWSDRDYRAPSAELNVGGLGFRWVRLTTSWAHAL